MAAASAVLLNVSSLPTGNTAAAHLNSVTTGGGGGSFLGTHLTADLEVSESVDITASLLAEKQTITTLNTTLNAETILNSLSANISC